MRMPRDWDSIDTILTDWAMAVKFGVRVSRCYPSQIRGSAPEESDYALHAWRELRVSEALAQMPPDKARSVRDLALRAYTERLDWCRLEPILELRERLAAAVAQTPFREFETA